MTGTLVCVFLFLLKFICLMGDKLIVPVDRFLVVSSLGPWGKKGGGKKGIVLGKSGGLEISKIGFSTDA